ncbi:MAG: nicotinate-nucleotide--dimethylbenzimidazole phosphoribosyltransferase [Halobacteriaceae archaeon]
MESTRLVLAAGTTRTARIEGLSAAGADPGATVHTPSADAEVLARGRPVDAPGLPVSPSGCPTPALVTRAVRERLDLPLTVLDAGLAAPTAAPTVGVGATPGGDVRDPAPVPDAGAVVESAREAVAGTDADRLLVAETVPGGTTTALGVLTALGVDAPVSSSLPRNPLDRKRAVVREGLAASGLDPGAAGPVEAIRSMGDPTLAAVAGTVTGAAAAGRRVTLAGGTQLLAGAALARALGADAPLELATTRYVADDVGDPLREAAARLDVDLTVTDPGFGSSDHRALTPYAAGEAKEGAGMGGALALARERGVSMAAVRASVADLYEALVARP